ncbi:MAG: PadR family transcriptional regulator [Chloroflexales bacterium]|nr:PadR family transcriptional regulator [Chloroflexales bacterium]
MLSYALLGLLARNPCSGYDLARLMQQRVNNFWHARHSQIYPTLAQLEAQGLVSHERVEQEDRPDKKLFSITEAGQAALQSWVQSPTALTPRRDELLLKAYSIWLADPQVAAALLRDHAELHREQMAHYEEKLAYLEQTYADQKTWPNPLFCSLAVIRCGIGQERAYAEWCEWMAGELVGHA